MMKVKKFNNLYTAGLILTALMLATIYVAKLVNPTFVIEIAQVDSITKVGHYIDSHKWLWYIVSGCLSFFVYWFYLCACCKRKQIGVKGFVCILITIIIGYIIKEFLPNQYLPFNVSSMIVLPYLLKGDFKATAFCFTTTTFLQSITLEIRNLAQKINDINFVTLLILMIDYYIYILLIYCMFNYKNKEV